MMATVQSDLPLSELTALTPLDGRYRKKTAPLSTYFSEYNLIRVRVEVETAFLMSLSNHKVVRSLTKKEQLYLESLGPSMTPKDVLQVKSQEEVIKHDVKAVELYLRKTLGQTSLKDLVEFIHFGLTSEDINNLSYRLMLDRASKNILLPEINHVLENLTTFSKTYQYLPMLGRTHGQAAVPTTLGKETIVFAARIALEYKKLLDYRFSGKLAGAVGNYNSLAISYPDINWLTFSTDFVTSLGLNHTHAVTQINTYEDVIEFFQILQRLNSILIDFDQDMWRYISDHWFIQEVKKQEVGSSTMPQKVNPILFENSEGNLGLANTLIEFFTRKLPLSRLQRDLTDSTVIRNFGSVYGYTLLGIINHLEGMKRVRPNEKVIEEVLMSDWSVLSEAAQTILRKNTVEDPYTMLKKLTRGEQITEKKWMEIIKNLPIDDEAKKSLLTLSPKKYIGLAAEIVDKTLREIGR